MLAIVVACGFLAALCGLAARGSLPTAVPAVYLAASVATFITYAGDKAAARTGAWRTRESTMHLLALAGGWPGALIAQNVLRHKLWKPSFRMAFWTTVALNCAALFALWRLVAS